MTDCWDLEEKQNDYGRTISELKMTYLLQKQAVIHVHHNITKLAAVWCNTHVELSVEHHLFHCHLSRLHTGDLIQVKL